MKRIVLFDTSFGSLNKGDQIINEAVSEELRLILENSFVVSYPTHTPVLHTYQQCVENNVINYCNNSDLKLICGTNIIKKRMFRLYTDWNINILNYRPYKGSILVGCGMDSSFSKTDYYTESLYKKILSDKYVHSTRDERTRRYIESLGFKAINTGCPTLWMLTKDFCKTIPHEKSAKVIFTLTDYCQDKEKDQQLINILNTQYKKVLFWIQGSNDLAYFNSLENTNGIELVSPNLAAYEKVLNNGDIDYVGTRLHAGIYAMRHKVRSIILIVDNRTRDMKETYNLVALERDSISEELEPLINSKFKTDVRIDEERITKWKSQFKDFNVKK